jgi:hypothetical protein
MRRSLSILGLFHALIQWAALGSSCLYKSVSMLTRERAAPEMTLLNLDRNIGILSFIVT